MQFLFYLIFLVIFKALKYQGQVLFIKNILFNMYV